MYECRNAERIVCIFDTGAMVREKIRYPVAGCGTSGEAAGGNGAPMGQPTGANVPTAVTASRDE